MSKLIAFLIRVYSERITKSAYARYSNSVNRALLVVNLKLKITYERFKRQNNEMNKEITRF